jgi:hypothetical protein
MKMAQNVKDSAHYQLEMAQNHQESAQNSTPSKGFTFYPLFLKRISQIKREITTEYNKRGELNGCFRTKVTHYGLPVYGHTPQDCKKASNRADRRARPKSVAERILRREGMLLLSFVFAGRQILHFSWPAAD